MQREREAYIQQGRIASSRSAFCQSAVQRFVGVWREPMNEASRVTEVEQSS